MLSHDLFEGVHGRVGLVTDVVLLEHFPGDYLSYAKRLHRWVRGDWQLLPWLGRHVPGEHDRRLPNRFSLIARWKIADNLRRTLLAPSLLAFLFLAWLWLPGATAVWTLLAVLVLAAPALSEAMGGFLAAGGQQGFSPALLSAASTLRPAAGLWALNVAFLPHRAAVSPTRSCARSSASSSAVAISSSGYPRPKACATRMTASRAAQLGADGRGAAVGDALAAALVAAVRPAALPAAAAAAGPVAALARPRPADQPAARPRAALRSPPRSAAGCAGSRGAPGSSSSLRRTRRPLATAGPLPGVAARRGGAAHVAHEHRDAAARAISAPRLRLRGAADGPLRAAQRLDTLDAHGAVPRATSQLVRHPRPRRRCSRAMSPRSTAATWPACLLAVTQDCGELAAAPILSPPPLAGSARHPGGARRGHRRAACAGRTRRPGSRSCRHASTRCAGALDGGGTSRPRWRARLDELAAAGCAELDARCSPSSTRAAATSTPPSWPSCAPG